MLRRLNEREIYVSVIACSKDSFLKPNMRPFFTVGKTVCVFNLVVVVVDCHAPFSLLFCKPRRKNEVALGHVFACVCKTRASKLLMERLSNGGIPKTRAIRQGGRWTQH